uniref:Uncharacterized protein n=1 Tax=Anguilla anguilla TaxID=7936 RepID=A0A0E9VXN7_ANGAN
MLDYTVKCPLLIKLSMNSRWSSFTFQSGTKCCVRWVGCKHALGLEHQHSAF